MKHFVAALVILAVAFCHASGQRVRIVRSPRGPLYAIDDPETVREHTVHIRAAQYGGGYSGSQSQASSSSGAYGGGYGPFSGSGSQSSAQSSSGSGGYGGYGR